MGLLGGTPAPARGESSYDATSRNLAFYEREATRHRLAFVGVGLVVIVGGVLVTASGGLGLGTILVTIVGAVIVLCESVSQLLQLQSRYVDYRVAAEAHRAAIEDYNARLERGDPRPEDAFDGLADLRRTEVGRWAEQTRAQRPGSAPARPGEDH